MPRNSAGTYTLPGAYNPVVADELITSEWANATLSDIASALTNSLDRYGNGGMVGSFRLADGTITSPGLAFTNDSTSGMARLSAYVLTMVVNGVAIAEISADTFKFLKPPITTLTPSEDTHLVPLGYAEDTFAPLLNPTFSASGAPSWAGTPALSTHLATKGYVDATAFAPVLPGQAGNAGKVVSTDGSSAGWVQGSQMAMLSLINQGLV